MTDNKLTLFINGRVIPKARPRVANKHGYLPANYRAWKLQAIDQIQSQLPHDWIPWTSCEILITFSGNHRGDTDNLAGSILDALTQGKAILDDRIGVVRRLVIEALQDTDTGTTIIINPW